MGFRRRQLHGLALQQLELSHPDPLLDTEIDRLVYRLYDLSQTEITRTES